MLCAVVSSEMFSDVLLLIVNDVLLLKLLLY